jgi:hypothetical protein
VNSSTFSCGLGVSVTPQNKRDAKTNTSCPFVSFVVKAVIWACRVRHHPRILHDFPQAPPTDVPQARAAVRIDAPLALVAARTDVAPVLVEAAYAYYVPSSVAEQA